MCIIQKLLCNKCLLSITIITSYNVNKSFFFFNWTEGRQKNAHNAKQQDFFCHRLQKQTQCFLTFQQQKLNSHLFTFCTHIYTHTYTHPNNNTMTENSINSCMKSSLWNPMRHLIQCWKIKQVPLVRLNGDGLYICAFPLMCTGIMMCVIHMWYNISSRMTKWMPSMLSIRIICTFIVVHKIYIPMNDYHSKISQNFKT